MAQHAARLLVIGAHPDDADLHAGGLAAAYSAADRSVCFVSLTNGNAGHHEMGGGALARRRTQEAQAAGDVIGIDYEVFDIHDGELRPTLANRRAVIRLIREFDPGLVLTHRPYDYHPDHRYTSQLVQDAAYMVTVPNICPQTPALERNPVIGYMHDDFERPLPFQPDVVYRIDEVAAEKLEMIHAHESQMYEWLPYNQRMDMDAIPDDPDARLEWLRDWQFASTIRIANEYRDRLRERYGQEAGDAVQYAEAVEISEYGASLTQEAAETLFPI